MTLATNWQNLDWEAVRHMIEKEPYCQPDRYLVVTMTFRCTPYLGLEYLPVIVIGLGFGSVITPGGLCTSTRTVVAHIDGNLYNLFISISIIFIIFIMLVILIKYTSSSDYRRCHALITDIRAATASESCQSGEG